VEGSRHNFAQSTFPPVHHLEPLFRLPVAGGNGVREARFLRPVRFVGARYGSPSRAFLCDVRFSIARLLCDGSLFSFTSFTSLTSFASFIPHLGLLAGCLSPGHVYVSLSSATVSPAESHASSNVARPTYPSHWSAERVSSQLRGPSSGAEETLPLWLDDKRHRRPKRNPARSSWPTLRIRTTRSCFMPWPPTN